MIPAKECWRRPEARQVEPAAPTIAVLISEIYIDSRPLESCQIIPHNGGLRPSERRGCRALFTALAATVARTREGSTCPHYNMRFYVSQDIIIRAKNLAQTRLGDQPSYYHRRLFPWP